MSFEIDGVNYRMSRWDIAKYLAAKEVLDAGEKAGFRDTIKQLENAKTFIRDQLKDPSVKEQFVNQLADYKGRGICHNRKIFGRNKLIFSRGAFLEKETERMQSAKEQWQNQMSDLNSIHSQVDQLGKAGQFQSKIESYQSTIDAYKADYEKKRSDFKSQLDSYSEAIKGIKNRQRKKELQESYNGAVQFFEKYCSSMEGKFAQAGIAGTKVKESIESFQQAVASNVENVDKLQQEVDEQFKTLYNNDGQIRATYWAGPGAKNTEEMFLKAKLQSLGEAIARAQKA